MDALVMCGGRGSRFESEIEKPLVTVGGVPMVDRVARALAESRVDRMYAVVSPHAPETAAHLSGELPRVETPGDGYVSDLRVALQDGPVEPPVLTVVADLPLLASGAVDRLLLAARDDRDVEREAGVYSTTTVVPTALKRELGVSVDSDGVWVPAGLNVVGLESDDNADGRGAGANARRSPGGTHRTWDARLAVNVNRKRDVSVAERLCQTEE